jgi:hypothetical protein
LRQGIKGDAARNEEKGRRFVAILRGVIVVVLGRESQERPCHSLDKYLHHHQIA